MVVLGVAGAIAFLKVQEATRNLADSYVERGQRARASGDVFESQRWFVKAVEAADTPLGRAGLIWTIGAPIIFCKKAGAPTPAKSWRAPASL